MSDSCTSSDEPEAASGGRLRVLVLGDRRKPSIEVEARQLLPWLETRADIVGFDLEQKSDLSEVDAHIAVVLGGDGAMLRAVRQMGRRQVPVIGINLGKLGFLAELSPDQFRDRFPELATRSYRVVDHMMLECEWIAPDGSREVHLGLNEVLVCTGPPFRLIDVELTVDGEHVTTYSGDGVIICTPIGSTAHSLAAGGPILAQDMRALVINPINPHTLTNRPLVDSDLKVYELSVPTATAGTTLIVDGHVQRSLTANHRVVVRRADVSFKLVKLAGSSYYRTLRDKLRWGGQPNYGNR